MKLYVNKKRNNVESENLEGYDVVLLGALNEKNNFSKLLLELGDDKELFVWNYESLDLNLLAVKRLLDGLTEKGITLKFIAEKESFLEHLMDICEREKKYLARRTKSGLKKAREKGNFGGRPRVTEEVVEKVRHLYFEKKLTYREIAAECNVSIGTVHKYSKAINAAK